jgi:hypothetical protein
MVAEDREARRTPRTSRPAARPGGRRDRGTTAAAARAASTRRASGTSPVFERPAEQRESGGGSERRLDGERGAEPRPARAGKPPADERELERVACAGRNPHTPVASERVSRYAVGRNPRRGQKREAGRLATRQSVMHLR